MKAKYRLKRKAFGLLGNIVGTTAQAVGSAADSGLGKTAGTLAGASIGAKIGGAATILGKTIPGVDLLGGIGGAIAGGIIGNAVTKYGGKALKQTGDDLRSN